MAHNNRDDGAIKDFTHMLAAGIFVRISDVDQGCFEEEMGLISNEVPKNSIELQKSRNFGLFDSYRADHSDIKLVIAV